MGFWGVSCGNLPATWRRTGQSVARPQPGAEAAARRGRDPLCPAAHRPAVPLRRGPQPDGRGPGQALSLAGHARQGPLVHVP